MNICSRCGKEKDDSEMHFDKGNGRIKQTKWCEDCDKKYHHEYYLKNKEYLLEKQKRVYENKKEEKKLYAKNWQKNNKDKRKIICQNWRNNNKEQVQISTAKWKKEHPDRVSASSERRRAKIKGVGGTVSDEEWKNILNKYGNICLRCGRGDVRLTMDHIIPVDLGGVHTVNNVQPLCQSCNSIKYLKTTDYRPFI